MTSIRKNNARLPWWLSGQESTCYHRRHGFDPWSGKIPHAVKQLSPCVKLLSPHATVTEPTHSRARTPQERPLQREAREPQLQSASHFPNLEKSLCCNKDLAQSDNNIKNNDKWKLLKIKKNNAKQNLQSQENAIKHHQYIFHRWTILLRFRGKVQGWLNWKPLVIHWDFHFWS